jgi:PhnB protein
MSKIDYKPEGFHSITPYLCVSGAAKLLDFMKQAFGAEEIGRHLRPDGTIAHACVKIGDSMVELGDVVPPTPVMPCAVHLYVPDVDAAYRRAVNGGGISQLKPTDQFYGERSASVRDMCGNHWYIATQTEILTKEEIEERAAKLAG